MDRKELPVGLQTFHTIRKRKGEYYYVDKTDYAYQLARKDGHFFLSRPRRFGKSLFVDTLKNLFEGNKELFEGLAIYGKWDWAVKYPVLRFSFAKGTFEIPGYLERNLTGQLDALEEEAEVELSSRYPDAPDRLAYLIRKIVKEKGQRVVILVDEYDKPIFDALRKDEVAEANRDYLAGFYATIKDCEENIRFSFLTGVTKFAHAGIFSGLNNLRDITLKPEFSSICGYTDHDLDTVFAPELENLEKLKKITRDEIKDWYNGYNWGGDEKVYNPFNILQLFDNRKLGSWWFHTGTPTFLINMLKERGGIDTLELAGMTADDELLSSLEIGDMGLSALLFQTVTYQKTWPPAVRAVARPISD